MYVRSLLAMSIVSSIPLMEQGKAEGVTNIYEATLQETKQVAPEISTDDLRRALADKTTVVLDARPYREYSISHIPGALNVAAKPGVPISQYVSDAAEIGRLVKNDKTVPLVLYCNGPFCGKSKRLSSELAGIGFTHVARYQLGIPVWRALGGATQIETDGLLYVFGNDRTAVFIDARDSEEFRSKTIPGAKSLPLSDLKSEKDSGEVETAKNDGRLPMLDHNTRIIVFGRDMAQARTLSEVITREAFHNVAFFGGSTDALLQAIEFARTDPR